MKKLILSITVFAASMTATAQQFVIIDGVGYKDNQFIQGQQAFLAEDIESFRYESDPNFRLMPSALASDEHTQLFSQALQLTGLADSLQAYFDYEYNSLDYTYKDGLYRISNHDQYAEVLNRRYIKFTAFVETDEVLAANGITSIEDLKAYAKRIYDDVFPEDAAVSDPTDRRNSLNRFVAYHILPFGASHSTLTAFPNYFDQRIADVADWYQTMMPEGSLKVSRPRTGNAVNTEIGLFLNRRGLQNGPDKYGVQVKGVEIGESVNTQNGLYFYINSPLVYDRKTLEETLQERWRVDFVTLSPDFMTARTRENQADINTPTFSNSKPATLFLPKHTNGIDFNPDADLIISPSRYYYWSYGGDEVDVCSVISRYDITIDLPCLPEGDWELRFGTCMMQEGPIIQATLDDGSQLTTTLNLANMSILENMGWRSYVSSDIYADILQQRAKIDELLLTLPTYKVYPDRYQERDGVLGVYDQSTRTWTPLSEEQLANEEFQAFLKSIVTEYRSAADIKQLINEKVMVSIDDTHIKDMMTGITYEERELTDDGYSVWKLFVSGTDEEVEKLPDYTEMFTRELFRLNGFLHGPAEYRMQISGGGQLNTQAMSSVSLLSRKIIGRFHSDGRTRHKLNIKSIYSGGGGNLDLDYLEFCPVSIADHRTIPED